jgi:hypothetical protein
MGIKGSYDDCTRLISLWSWWVSWLSEEEDVEVWRSRVGGIFYWNKNWWSSSSSIIFKSCFIQNLLRIMGIMSFLTSLRLSNRIPPSNITKLYQCPTQKSSSSLFQHLPSTHVMIIYKCNKVNLFISFIYFFIILMLKHVFFMAFLTFPFLANVIFPLVKLRNDRKTMFLYLTHHRTYFPSSSISDSQMGT